jgi:hypothetical protein
LKGDPFEKESYGFKFIWIPFASPTDGAAKRDMLDRLKNEGIDTKGKNIALRMRRPTKAGSALSASLARRLLPSRPM